MRAREMLRVGANR
jgi:hypothetical protein